MEDLSWVLGKSAQFLPQLRKQDQFPRLEGWVHFPVLEGPLKRNAEGM